MFAITRNTSSQDAMYWHVAGESPPPPAAPLNCMNKIVRWYRDGDVPILQKIGMTALGALATLAIGYLLGQTLLFSALVTLITGSWAAWENSKIKEEENQAALDTAKNVRMLELQRIALTQMQAIFGGEEACNALPVLEIGERMGSTGYIDFLRPHELSASIMKGTDKYHRPFFAMKVHPNGDPANIMVLVLFQRYTKSDTWVDSFRQVFLNAPIANADREQLRQIVQGQHPRYTLSH